MTFRNLNETWRDVVFRTYAQDHQDDVPFPVTYLVWAAEWKRDIIIEVPKKIDVKAYRHSVLKFTTNLRFQDPVYDDEYISVRPRVSKYKIGESREQAQAQQGEVGRDSASERSDS